MNPEVTLCEHLRGDALDRLAIAPGDVLDWCDGPVTAVARCPRCAGLGILEMLDWSRSRALRVYALAALRPDALAIYRRNVERGSCDPGRAAREVEALFSSAGRSERLVALRAPDAAVVAAAPMPEGRHVPYGSWQERLPREADTAWFALLGLDKSAA